MNIQVDIPQSKLLIIMLHKAIYTHIYSANFNPFLYDVRYTY